MEKTMTQRFFIATPPGRRVTSTLEASHVNVWATILLMCGFVSATASASEGYQCVADMTTGFKFDVDRQQWRSTNFTADRKYIISKITDKAVNKRYTWEVKQVGDPAPVTICEDFSNNGILDCGGLSEFRMNKNKLRYLRADLFGYWIDPNALINANALSIEIGKCSPL